MINILPFILVLIFTGLLAGFLAGLFGVGGGLVFVPVLFFVFNSNGVNEDVAMSLAVGTSLATILFTATSSALSHSRLANIDWRIVWLWCPAVLGGAFLGSQFVHPDFGALLVIVFICLLLFIAANLFLNIGQRFKFSQQPRSLLHLPFAFVIGFVSVLAGVGGGAMTVPTLLVMGINAHRAIGTSALIGLFIVVPALIHLLMLSETPATAPRFTVGLINYFALIILAFTSVLSAPFGAKLGKKLDELTLKRLFAACLLLVAASMYLKAF